MTFNSNLKNMRDVLLQWSQRVLSSSVHPPWDSRHVHAVVEGGVVGRGQSIPFSVFLCCHNKQIPSMCATKQKGQLGQGLKTGNWDQNWDWDWDWELGPELLPTFAWLGLVSSGVQQEFNYTFDFNENTTSVLRRIYPVRKCGLGIMIGKMSQFKVWSLHCKASVAFIQFL